MKTNKHPLPPELRAAFSRTRSPMKTDLRIPILHKKLGVAELTPADLETLAAGLAEPANRLPEIVGALINVHKADYSDTRQIRDKFAGMELGLRREDGTVYLLCRGVPVDCLYDGRNVIWAACEFISSAIRDIVFPPPGPAPDADSAATSLALRRFAEHAGVLYRGERNLVSFVWGGHRVDREEYEFAKEVAYWATLFLPHMEHITGCGEGIMKAPFKGAQVAYAKQRTYQRFGLRDFIGFTEKNILAAEPPNELVNRFVVYPCMEWRLEAFIRASHCGRAHPGGPGTMEEVMTMLALLLDPANRGCGFAFDLVEREGGTYFTAFEEYLRECFGNALNGLYEIHRGAPAEYARTLAERAQRIPTRYLWNEELRFDPRFQAPFAVTFASMEALDLSRDQAPQDLLINLRRFFHAIVHVSVKDPDLLDSWGADRPRIRGDARVLTATDRLVRRLAAQGRIHPDADYTLPYRVE